MGNSLPLPCVRHHHEADEAEGTAAGAGGAKKWRKQKRPACLRKVRAARPGHVVPVVDMPAEDGGEEKEGELGFKLEAWRPKCRVEPPPAGFGEDDGAGGVRRVKIVMRRKDIAELVARLEQRDAAGRNAAMMEVELNGGLGNGYGGRGGSVTVSPCRLSIIPENY